MVQVPRHPALGLALGMCLGACFDSDDKFRLAVEGTTTTGLPATTTTDPSTSTGEPPASSSGQPDFTCRDAIGCLRDCALSIDPNDPEPDLTCITACVEETGLTVNETYKLLRLIECISGVCEAAMECTPTSDTTGTGTGTGTGTTGPASSSEAGGPEFFDPCLFCIFTRIQDANSSECAEFHDFCE